MRRRAHAARLVLAALLISCGSGTDQSPPETVSEGDATRGKALAVKSSCAACHGGNYAGDGAFTPNLTPDATGLRDWTDEQISSAIRKGIDDEGERLCNTMVPFPFSDQETADVIAFLRGLPAVEKATPSECPGHGR